MKIGKFWFQPGTPDEVIEACKQPLIDNEHLIPSWCEEVRVYWDSQGEVASHSSSLCAAYIETSYAYRYANLSICPPFLSEAPADRAVRIIHELSHIVTAPLVYYVRDVVAIFGKDEAVNHLVTREIGEKTESVTEDLTNIFLKTLKKNDDTQR